MVEERKVSSVKIVNNWEDDPETQEVRYHCMEMLAPGVHYHYRLNKIFIVRSAAFSQNKVS